MRIFNLDKILSFALYPDGNKKRNRNSQGYCLSIDQYSKNGSDETDTGTLKNHLKNMKVLCLGVLAESKNMDQPKLGAIKFRVKKTERYEVKKEFQSPNENIPLPLFLFYKKKKTKPFKALKALTDILKPSFFEIIGLHQEKNLDLKKLEMSKEDIIKINGDYQIKVTEIAEKIFNELEVSRPDIVITGIFVDPYFIRKTDGKLFLEDTRPSDTLPKSRNSPSYEQNLLDDSDSLKSMEPEAESCDYDTLSNDSSMSDISASLELSPFEFIEELPKNLSVTESESVIDVVDDIQLKAEVDMLNTTVGLAVIPQAEEKIIASIHTNQNLIPSQDKLDDWNAETKINITMLLFAYQKKLTKKYFFRSNDHITDSKKYITADLLDKLNGSPENFYSHAYGISTANILNKHRDITIIQRIGQFFKCHNKTKGTLLLENILSTLENDLLRNSLSV
ncbi:MAG: hypothetical protein RJA25_1890 [Bacteroidota bacterium]|jgi:hypothetical protein